MEKGLQAALRRFPLKGQEIRRHALANSTFRSLCDDLADAEAASNQWGQSPSPQSNLRRSEYQILAEELATEIEQMLGALSDEKHRSERF